MPSRPKNRVILIALGVLALVSLALVFGLRKTVHLNVDGNSQTITTYSFTVGSLLHDQGIPLSPSDKLSPPVSAWLSHQATVTLVHAIPVQILVDGTYTTIYSPERTPSALLKQANINSSSGDILLSDGKTIAMDQSFPLDIPSISLQLIRSVSVTLTENGTTKRITSAAPNLASAVWAAGYPLFGDDRLSPDPGTPLTEGLAATLTRSRPVTIHTQSGEVSLRTAASSVGEALLAAHLSLQGLDYSIPAADQSIPANGLIRLVRVTEQVVIEETPIPFETEFQPLSDLELDSQSVVQAGQNGITARRVRIRYEDGAEASRKQEDEWVAREPKNRIIGYGTSAVMHTATVDGVTIDYWRSITVWVTSYHPSETGSNRTATGALVEKGVVGVNPNFIPFHTRMYIPGYGYGQAEDTGNIGAYWIDLAYPDDEYIPWHQYVTIYFLWPPPDNIVWILP